MEAKEAQHMSRTTALFVGIAALSIISTVAEAADGCGRGWYYNGRRCVPQDGPGYGYGPPSRSYGPPAGYYEAPPPAGPQLGIDLGGRRNETQNSPTNQVFNTPNNSPSNYIVKE